MSLIGDYRLAIERIDDCRLGHRLAALWLVSAVQSKIDSRKSGNLQSPIINRQ
jgi:hypothetical protein